MSTARLGGRAGRQSWDEYFLGLAAAAATRSNCVRRQVGAVVVSGRHIRSTGYNGPPSGYGHCDEGACPRANADGEAGSWPAPGEMSGRAVEEAYDNCVALHAEANALLFSGPDERAGATIYTTAAPCFACAKLVANSGIGEVVAAGGRYEGWEQTRAFLIECGVRVRVLDGHEHATPLPLQAVPAR